MKRAVIVIYESDDTLNNDGDYLMSVIEADAIDVLDYEIEDLSPPYEHVLAHDYVKTR